MTEMTGGVWRRRGDRLAVTVRMIPEARDCRWIGSDGLRRHDDGRVHSDRDSPQDLVEWQCGLPEPQSAMEVQATADRSDTETRHEAEPSPGGVMSEGNEGNSSTGNFTPEYTESIESLRDDRDRLKSALAESNAAAKIIAEKLSLDSVQAENQSLRITVADLQSQIVSLQRYISEADDAVNKLRQQLQDRDADDQVPGIDWKAEAEAQNAINEALQVDVKNLREAATISSQRASDMTEQKQDLERRNQDLVLEITRLKQEHAKQITDWQAGSEAMSGQIVELRQAKAGGFFGDQEDVAELEARVETLNAKVLALKTENIGLKQKVSNQAEKNRQLSDELDATKVRLGKLRNTITELEATEHNLLEEAKKIVEQLEQAKAQLESQKLNSQTANSVVSMWQQRAQQLEKDLQAELQNHQATEIRLDEVRRLLLFLVQNVHCHNNDPTEDAQ